MSTLVDEKFGEWTSGVDGIDGAISIFEHIRDIPYSLAVPMTDPNTAPEQILSQGKGYCGPKHYLLAEMFRRIGYEVVYAMFPFLWNDPDLMYPQPLRELATGLPVAHHLACRVRINNCWVLVDATWDLPLARGGFPVNKRWDGLADTLCAVKPLQSPVRTATNQPSRNRREQDLNPIDGEQDYGDAGVHERYYRGKVGMRTAAEIEQLRRFYLHFDDWLQELREHG
jgi:hypothetical protein